MKSQNYKLYFVLSLLIGIGLMLFMAYNVDKFDSLPCAPLIFVILLFIITMFPFVSYSILIKIYGIASEEININNTLNISKRKVKNFIVDDNSYERKFYKQFPCTDVYERIRLKEKIRIMLIDLDDLVQNDMNLENHLNELSLYVKDEIARLSTYERLANFVVVFTQNYEENMLELLYNNTYTKAKYGRTGSSLGDEIMPCIVDTKKSNIIFGGACPGSDPFLYEEYKNIIVKIILLKSIYK